MEEVRKALIIDIVLAVGKHTRKILRRHPINLGKQYGYVCDLNKLVLGVYFGNANYKQDSKTKRRQIVKANFHEVNTFFQIYMAMSKNTYKPTWRERWEWQNFFAMTNGHCCPAKPPGWVGTYPWFMTDPKTFNLHQIVNN